MNDSLLARKGEAIPSGLDAGSRYALAHTARRVIAFGGGDRSPVTPSNWLSTAMARAADPRPAARILTDLHPQSAKRHRFTFRLDKQRHQRFCEVADTLGCSRQKLLERALDRHLDALEAEGPVATAAGRAVPRLV